MMGKTVHINIFEWEGGKAGVFKVFPPVARREGNLKTWIELSGGVVLEEDEEDPFMIPVVDIEWFLKAELETPVVDEIPLDHFHPSFIYDCYEWERVFDLNGYRIGKSRFVQYDANQILKRCVSWSELLQVSPAYTQNKEAGISTGFILRCINNENSPEDMEMNPTNQKDVDNKGCNVGGGNYISLGDDLVDSNVETDHGFVARVEIENDDELVLNGYSGPDDDNVESEAEVLVSPIVTRKLSVSAKKRVPKSKSVPKNLTKPLSASAAKNVPAKEAPAEKKTAKKNLLSEFETAESESSESKTEHHEEGTRSSNLSTRRHKVEKKGSNVTTHLRTTSEASKKVDANTELNAVKNSKLVKTSPNDINEKTDYSSMSSDGEPGAKKAKQSVLKSESKSKPKRSVTHSEVSKEGQHVNLRKEYRRQPDVLLGQIKLPAGSTTGTLGVASKTSLDPDVFSRSKEHKNGKSKCENVSQEAEIHSKTVDHRRKLPSGLSLESRRNPSEITTEAEVKTSPQNPKNGAVKRGNRGEAAVQSVTPNKTGHPKSQRKFKEATDSESALAISEANTSDTVLSDDNDRRKSVRKIRKAKVKSQASPKNDSEDTAGTLASSDTSSPVENFRQGASDTKITNSSKSQKNNNTKGGKLGGVIRDKSSRKSGLFNRKNEQKTEESTTDSESAFKLPEANVPESSGKNVRDHKIRKNKKLKRYAQEPTPAKEPAIALSSEDDSVSKESTSKILSTAKVNHPSKGRKNKASKTSKPENSVENLSASTTSELSHTEEWTPEDNTTDSETPLAHSETSAYEVSDSEIRDEKGRTIRKSTRKTQRPTAAKADAATTVATNPTLTKRFSCDKCSFTSPKVYDLIDHQRKHPVGVLFRCPKEGCNFSTPMKSTLSKHGRQEHPTSKNASSQNHLTKDTSHPPEKLHKCEHEGCDFSTTARYQLRLHSSNHKESH